MAESWCWSCARSLERPGVVIWNKAGMHEEYCNDCYERYWERAECRHCGQSIAVNKHQPGPRPFYCQDCYPEVEREQARARMARMRQRRRVTGDTPISRNT